MKTNKDYILRYVAGDHILIPTGKAAGKFNGMINLSDVAVFIWNNIDACADIDALVQKVVTEYEVDEATARRDTEKFVNALIENDMIEA